MRLKVEWIGATRPLDEKRRVEATVRDTILVFFNGVENAKSAHDHTRNGIRSPYDDWARAVYQGYRAIKGYVTPCEYSRANFKITFEERELA